MAACLLAGSRIGSTFKKGMTAINSKTVVGDQCMIRLFVRVVSKWSRAGKGTNNFKGMDSFITTKTVVGDAITVGDTIILPLVDVSFGVGAGAFAEGNKNNGAGGMGGKISPSAVLVINKNGTKLVNVKNQDAITKILDMVPDLADKFTGKDKDDANTSDDIEHILNQEEKKQGE